MLYCVLLMARKGQIQPDSSIAIVGGSLTGPALALLLMRGGFENIAVYEALPAAIPLSGGVIGLDHVTLGTLDLIGIDQDEIVPFPSERVISIKVLDRHRAGRVSQLWPGRNTTWNLLHDALMRRIPPETYHHSHRVTGLDKNGHLSLHFADGDSAEADFVAFADGRRSTGRSLLDPTRKLRYAGYVAYRGQVIYDTDDIRDFVRLEPAHAQFNMFPVPMAHKVGLDWTFYLGTSVREFREAFGAHPIDRTFITNRQMGESVRRKVDCAAERLLPPAQADLVQRTTTRAAVPILDIGLPRRMMRKVGESTAVLIGDALAPVRPHTARGANNGIEEAAGLAVALTQSHRFDADLRTALRGWQSRYLPMVADSLRRGPELGRGLGL